MPRLIKDITTITPQQQADFRFLLMNFIEQVPKDQDEMIRRVMHIEQWISEQIGAAVFEALKPYIKMDIR
jgi:hypothetical protein